MIGNMIDFGLEWTASHGENLWLALEMAPGAIFLLVALHALRFGRGDAREPGAGRPGADPLDPKSEGYSAAASQDLRAW